MKKSFIIIIGVVLLSVLLCYECIPDPHFKNLSDEAKHYVTLSQYRSAEEVYLKLLKQDSTNIEYHQQYILNHFKIPKQERVGKSTFINRDDITIYYYYLYKTHRNDTTQNNIGNYALGLYYSYAENYSTALSYLQQVSNKSQKYYNNILGNVYKQSDYYSYAAYYFHQELINKGDSAGAYNNYVDLCFITHRNDKLKTFIEDSSIRKYVDYQKVRTGYYLLGNTSGYINTVRTRFGENINSSGFLGALIILIIWLYFLRKIDVFEKEKWVYIIITCLMGMLFTFGSFILYDFIEITLKFKLGGNPISDLFYCIFGIGTIEELVKFIPVLIMLKFSKEINEPIDYIIYASTSALGFAFIENLLYFNDSGLISIHGRALSAVITHMFNSSVISYGLVLCRFRFGGDKYAYLFIAYLIAATSHGFYDYWLISEFVIKFKIITLLYMIFTFVVYNKIISNALNNSSFFDEEKLIKTSWLKDYLLYSLSAVLLVEYLIITYRFGPTAGNNALFNSIISGAYLTIFISAGLTKFKPNPGEWIPLIKLTTRTKITHPYTDQFN